MTHFNYPNELKKIIDNKQLVQIYFHGAAHEFKVAYILSANSEYLTLIEINDTANLDGVTICRMDDVDTIKVETIYLSELAKQITDNSLYQQAVKSIASLKKFSFEGFISNFENTSTIIEILTEKGDTFTGRIIGHDDIALALDEFSAKSNQRLARCYIDIRVIARIAIDIPYLRILTKSLADKNL